MISAGQISVILGVIAQCFIRHTFAEDSELFVRERRHHLPHVTSGPHGESGHYDTPFCGNDTGSTFSECMQTRCISPESILDFYNISQEGINSTETYHPDIPTDVLILVKYFCFHETVKITPVEKELTRSRRSTPAEAWGYATGFVLGINCISMVGSVLVPIMDKPFYKKTLVMLVALGVGAMAGTSIFVLIPEALDLMNIEETAEGYKWKCATLVCSLFVFYIIEQAMRLNSAKQKEIKEKKEREKQIHEERELLEMGKKKLYSKEENSEVLIESDIEGHGHSHGLSKDGEVATVAWVVLCADGIHKFVDGLSIGAGFANTIGTGVSVAVAIVCEELPHELGDIAILVHSGMDMKKALLYNLLVSLPCLAGMAIGILLSNTISADKWIFAVAGGVFMYIALVDMLPEIRSADEKDPAYKTFRSKVSLAIMQDIGLLLGFVIILILTVVF